MQQLCAAKQHIEACFYAKKMKNIDFLIFHCKIMSSELKRGYIEFKYYADAIHSGLTPPG